MSFALPEGMEVDDNSTGTAGERVEESAFLSDASSFYGDENTKAEYELRSTAWDPTRFWASQQRSLQWIAEQNREAAEAKAARSRPHSHILNDVKTMDHESSVNASPNNAAEVPRDCDPMDIDPPPRQEDKPEAEVHNPWEGDSMAKQLHEPLPAFLHRLPPSTTPLTSGPWIWIANPRSPRQGRCDIAGLKQEGHRLLSNFVSQRRYLEAKNPDKPQGVITRMTKPAKDLLEEDIVKLARERNLLNGKWMLFPSPSHVDEVWAKVARATDAGELGMGAKVATARDDDDLKRSPKSRLICVYTRDFSDKGDVKRVLVRLRDLGLVQDEQGIFYKCDAYTYLDIMNGNEFKLKASMYGSKGMLKEE